MMGLADRTLGGRMTLGQENQTAIPGRPHHNISTCRGSQDTATDKLVVSVWHCLSHRLPC